MMTAGRAPRSLRLGRIACWVTAAAALLGGCAHQLPQAGPSVAEIVKSTSARKPGSDYVLINLDSRVAAELQHVGQPSFLAVFGDRPAQSEVRINPGDYVTVTFWEAASTTSLLGSGGGSTDSSAGTSSTLHEVVPEQIVSPEDGTIEMPFAGRLHVAGLSIVDADKMIRQALHGIASNPQVLLTITHDTSNQAAVVGDDVKGMSFPLTPNVDRILDAVAAAGGVQSPVYQAQVRLTRDGRQVTIGLDRLLTTPPENIHLHPNDVLSVLKNPEFFTMLGAVGHNERIQFQNDRMNLDEAIGNAGGLVDQQADPSGVFLFRFESKARVQHLCPTCEVATLGEVVPVVYRLNMRHVDAFFVAHTVQMADGDVVFVSTAPEVQLAKIFAAVHDAASPVIAAGVLARTAEN